jgi:hypothetical protein
MRGIYELLTEMVVIEYSDLRTRATSEMTRTRVWASNRPTRATRAKLIKLGRQGYLE